MKKSLLLMAVIAALPITANATGPAHDSGNSPVVATASAPYQTVTPEAHADEHIASTKYVIGAYNDAIAAVNKVDSEKQGKLVTTNNLALSSTVFDQSAFEDILYDIGSGVRGWDSVFPDFQDNQLVTARAVAGGVESYVFGYMESHPIEIYTTWDDDETTNLYISDLGE